MASSKRKGQGKFSHSLRAPTAFLELPRVLGKLSYDLNDWTEAFEEAKAIVSDAMMMNVERRQPPPGANWHTETSASDYVTRKRREGFGKQELVRTGDLVRQLGRKSGGYSRVTRTSLVWGTSGIPGAAAVNFGSKKRNIKSKAYFWFNRNHPLASRLQKLFDKHTAKKFSVAQQALAGMETDASNGR